MWEQKGWGSLLDTIKRCTLTRTSLVGSPHLRPAWVCSAVVVAANTPAGVFSGVSGRPQLQCSIGSTATFYRLFLLAAKTLQFACIEKLRAKILPRVLLASRKFSLTLDTEGNVLLVVSALDCHRKATG